MMGPGFGAAAGAYLMLPVIAACVSIGIAIGAGIAMLFGLI